MATTTAFGTSRERMEDLAREYKGMLNRMVAGEMVANAPWADPRFQEMVNQELGRHRQWKCDAEKLAIVKEVFGGK